MAAAAGPAVNHDDLLMNVLVENKTLVGFLFSVFGFLSRKTDFYMIRDESDADSVGFPPGIAEELVLRVLRKCNSGNVYTAVPENCHELIDDRECVPPPVAEEVEIEATEEITCEDEPVSQPETSSNINLETLNIRESVLESNKALEEDYFSSPSNSRTNEPNYPDPEMVPSCLIESQTHPETYNGAKRDKYSWSQTIRELDVTVLLPEDVKSSKQLKIDITSDSMNIQYLSSQKEWVTLVKDKLTNKTKAAETIWTMSEGKVRIQLEKQSEMWWNSLLDSEEKIDTTKIDCSRPLDELPEDHIAKVRELQWNQLQKLAGKPTSDELKKQEILKKAWNMPGSPFANTPYDPNVFH